MATRSMQFWAGQDRRIYARFYVSRPDGVTWQDMTGYLTSARISLGNIAEVGTGNSGVDAVVRQATFELMNDRPTVDSLHPLDRTSSWNLLGGVYAPLLWPNREVILDVAAVPIGVTPSDADWVRMFHGFMGDSISGSSDSGRITLECRDKAKRLQDLYIEATRQYGSEAGTPAETVIQQIINDNITYSPPTLYCPVSPGFMVKPYKVEYQSVWDAIQQVAAQIGWFLGYKWIPDYNDFRLSFLAPPRGKDAASADWDLTAVKTIVQQLEITDRDVRNVFIGAYRDASTGMRASVTIEDATSIAAYGRRAMQIEEADTSLIDTAAEMKALLENARHDLKDLTATTRLTLPFLPTLDIFDALLVTNPRLSSTQDFYGVETVEHTLDFNGGKFRTEVVGSGRVIGGHARWLLMETRPGSPGKPVPKTPRFTLIVAAKDSPYDERRNADYFCDGVADQEQINAAVTALGSAGGEVRLLKGTFSITDSIILPSNVTIRGQGPGTVVKPKDNLGLVMVYLFANSDDFNGNENITIADIRLDGNRVNNVLGTFYGIRFSHVSRYNISHLQLVEVRDGGIFCVESPDGVISGNYFEETGAAAATAIYLGANCDRCTVTGNVIKQASGSGIAVAESVSCAITGNTINNITYHGIVLSRVTASGLRHTVTGNTIQNARNAGIQMSACNCTVTGNTIRASGTHGIHVYYGDNNTIANNYVAESGQVFDSCDNIHVSNDADYNTIQGNTCRKGSLARLPRYGIRINTADCNGNMVTNNDLYLSGASGSLSDAGTGTVTSAGNRL